MGETGTVRGLAETLKLADYQPEDDYFGVRRIVDCTLPIRYAFLEDYPITEEHLRKEIRGFVSVSVHFLKYIGSSSDGNFKLEDLLARIDAADKKEVDEVCSLLTDKAKVFTPTSYYGAGVSLYHRMMKSHERFSHAMVAISSIAEEALMGADENTTLEERASVFGRKVISADAYMDLPRQYRRELGVSVTFQGVERLRSALLECNTNLHKLHEEIVSYGKTHFGKNELDVFLDIMGCEYLSSKGLLHLSPLAEKGGNAISYLGAILISGHGPEFIRGYGEERKPEWLDRGYEALKAAREKDRRDVERGMMDYQRVQYKSFVNDRKTSEDKPERTEEEDDKLVEALKARFGSFIAFSGDYLQKNMHGSFVFFKVVEVDVRAMVNQGIDPKLKVEAIMQYIKSACPQD